jgi:hypothetical protein
MKQFKDDPARKVFLSTDAGGGGASSLQKALQGLLSRDEATGKTYLKIPLPEAEAMNRIVSGFGQLLSEFMGMNR